MGAQMRVYMQVLAHLYLGRDLLQETPTYTHSACVPVYVRTLPRVPHAWEYAHAHVGALAEIAPVK